MLGSDVLDIGIGMTLLFLFASLVCSAMREAIETVMKSRAMDLERGIREMLKDPAGNQITEKLFEHPSIFGLYTGSYDPSKLTVAKYIPGAAGTKVMPRAARSNLPTYIPSQNFSAALVDIVRLTTGPDAPLSAASLREGASKIDNVPIRYAVVSALDAAGDDVAAARKNIEAWYDSAMDRVSGWYKRRTQAVLLAIGLGTAVLFNIDAITVARHLATEKTYREAIVASVPAIRQALEARQSERVPAAGPVQAAAPDAGAALPPAAAPAPADRTKAAAPPAAAPGKVADAAKNAAKDVPDATASGESDAIREVRGVLSIFDGSGFALGWPAPQFTGCRPQGSCGVGTAIQMAAGWIVTALAVSLGAPFWFDLLNKFMVIRSTVKPSEKSGAEGSKDSAPGKPKGSSDATLNLVVKQEPAVLPADKPARAVPAKPRGGTAAKPAGNIDAGG